MTTIADYFPGELNLLRDAAQALARDDAALAGVLQGRPDDPDVARLLEGVAFLTAGLRARIDQAGAEVARSLAELLVPHVLRPLPAATIVEFTPDTRALRARHHVPKGRSLLARPLAGTACRFRTCLDVDLWPLTVAGARLDERSGGAPTIELSLALAEAARSALRDPRPLRFFLHHPDLAQSATLLLWLTRHLSGVTVLTSRGVAGRLPPAALAPLPACGHPVFPWPDTAPAGLRSLLELFVLPERHCFVELSGLHALALDDAALTLRLEFERPPPLPAALGPASFRLHCAPAINLFEAPGEPIVRTPLTRESLVRADGVDPRHMEVHEVTQVHAHSRAHGRRRRLVPFARVPHERGAASFALRRVRAPDGGVDTFLSLPDAPLDEEILSTDLLCTNRALARDLQVGDLRDDHQGALCRGATNITPVIPPASLAPGDDALWHLLAHLALTPRGPADAESLRSLLRLYNVHPASPRGRAGSRQIDAVRALRREHRTRLVRGVPVRALRTTLELDERALGGPGPAYLFGNVLDDLFATLGAIGGAGELRVTLLPGHQELAWPVRSAE